MVALFFLSSVALARYKTFSARRNWKEEAIPTITRLADDKNWVRKEIDFLTDGKSGPGQRLLAYQWLSDRMILMESGEWLIYRSHCHKEPPHDVEDICIAKGSDGKWYYTTCHFCVNMTALKMMQDDQPKNLDHFVRRYHLRTFDGESDECLKTTKGIPNEL